MEQHPEEAIWNKSWSAGHSVGYHNVLDLYDDFAEIAKIVAKIVAKDLS